jgi:hypothetical protein
MLVVHIGLLYVERHLEVLALGCLPHCRLQLAYEHDNCWPESFDFSRGRESPKPPKLQAKTKMLNNFYAEQR